MRLRGEGDFRVGGGFFLAGGVDDRLGVKLRLGLGDRRAGVRRAGVLRRLTGLGEDRLLRAGTDLFRAGGLGVRRGGLGERGLLGLGERFRGGGGE